MAERLLNDDECEVVLSLHQIAWLVELMDIPSADAETTARKLNTRHHLQDAVLRRAFELAKSKAARRSEL